MTTSLVPSKTCRRFQDIWRGIKRRCNTKKNSAYPYYGARGIKLCKRWRTYNNFCRDMYLSYRMHVQDFGEANTSLDRKNVNGDYKPSNCRWATRREQAANKQKPLTKARFDAEPEWCG